MLTVPADINKFQGVINQSIYIIFIIFEEYGLELFDMKSASTY